MHFSFLQGSELMFIIIIIFSYLGFPKLKSFKLSKIFAYKFWIIIKFGYLIDILLINLYAELGLRL